MLGSMGVVLGSKGVGVVVKGGCGSKGVGVVVSGRGWCWVVSGRGWC